MIGYGLAFVVYNLGGWAFYGTPFGIMQGIACVLIAVALYFILRPAAPYRKTVPAAQGAD